MTRQTISATKARELMYLWHAGTSCPLYALASNGAYHDKGRALELLKLGAINPNLSKADRKQWAQMLAYIRAYGGDIAGRGVIGVSLPWCNDRALR